MKIINVNSTLTVILSDGTVITRKDCSDELFNQVIASQHDEEVVTNLLSPGLQTKRAEYEEAKSLISSVDKSLLLTRRNDSVYFKAVSEISVPNSLITAILKAEQAQDEELIQTYTNFWTLCCLNPDSRVRENLFWFLEKYGMTISNSGLFVAYRNVLVKEEGAEFTPDAAAYVSSEYSRIKFSRRQSPRNYAILYDGKEHRTVNVKTSAENWEQGEDYVGNLQDLYVNLGEENATVYTDAYSRTFEIKIGQMVSIPRESCDPDQTETCSNGLHVAGLDWLRSGYFGKVSLQVLVSPSSVVAVPPEDDYGKMRTCAYFPVQVVQRDKSGKIIPPVLEDGFQDDFWEQVSYEGDMSDEDTPTYTLKVPNIPEISSSLVQSKLSDIKGKVVHKLEEYAPRTPEYADYDAEDDEDMDDDYYGSWQEEDEEDY